jgi:transcriptional regulator with XRE-family HTH domain
MWEPKPHHHTIAACHRRAGMDDRKLLGQRIKELRQARGWSQEELAERMESGAKYVSSLERGRENPTLDMLVNVARTLKVEPVDLFNYAWLKLSESEIRKKIKTLADRADSDRLRDILALVKARET